jgi:hypothetical protein
MMAASWSKTLLRLVAHKRTVFLHHHTPIAVRHDACIRLGTSYYQQQHQITFLPNFRPPTHCGLYAPLQAPQGFRRAPTACTAAPKCPAGPAWYRGLVRLLPTEHPAAWLCLGPTVFDCPKPGVSDDVISGLARHVRGNYQPVSVCWGAVWSTCNCGVPPAAAMRGGPGWCRKPGSDLAGVFSLDVVNIVCRVDRYGQTCHAVMPVAPTRMCRTMYCCGAALSTCVLGSCEALLLHSRCSPQPMGAAQSLTCLLLLLLLLCCCYVCDGLHSQLVCLLVGVTPVVVAQWLSHQSTSHTLLRGNVTHVPGPESLSAQPHSHAGLPQHLLYVLLSGLVASRFGLWLFDLAVTQLQQELVQEAQLGEIGLYLLTWLGRNERPR